MKIRTALILIGLLVSSGPVFGQAAGQRVPRAPGVQPANVDPEAALTRFDLDFPGGTPEQLVRAIEKASGKPLNAIIPNEHADLQLPPLRMKSVTVPALFAALEMASAKSEMYATGTYDFGSPTGVGTRTQYSSYQSSYGFQTQGTLGDDSVWYFVCRTRPRLEEPKTCRIYHLAPYLETYKVEDITTAIQTGWKMLGEKDPPTVSYHKDTKLLITVGEAYKLQLIDEVLRQLSNPKPDVKPSQPKPAATEKPSKSQ